MIPAKIQSIMLDVRLKENSVLDFEDVLNTYLSDTYELNEFQANLCLIEAKTRHCEMEQIYFLARDYAIFANKIIKHTVT